MYMNCTSIIDIEMYVYSKCLFYMGSMGGFERQTCPLGGSFCQKATNKTGLASVATTYQALIDSLNTTG